MKQANGFGLVEVLVVVVIVTLIGGGVYLWFNKGQTAGSSHQTTPTVTPTPTPPPDPTAGWQRYTNPYHGYTLKYPPAWYLYVPESAGGSLSLANYDVNQIWNVEPGTTVNLSPANPTRFKLDVLAVTYAPPGTSLEDWMADNDRKAESTNNLQWHHSLHRSHHPQWPPRL